MQRFYLILFFVLAACSDRRLSSAPNDLGVDIKFPADADSSYKSLLENITDSLLRKQPVSPLHMHRKKESDSLFLVIDITKAKPATNKQIKNGYFLSGIGLVGLPAAMIALNVGFVLGFYYFPQHKIDGRIYVQQYNQSTIKALKRLNIRTNALFTPHGEQLHRMQIKAQKKMTALFIRIQKKVPSKRGM